MTTATDRQPTLDEFGLTLPQAWTDAGVTVERGTGVLLVPLKMVQESPFQTRSQQNVDDGIEELRDNILNAGQVVPVEVRPIYTFDSKGAATIRKFQLVHGHRRYRALKISQAHIKEAKIEQFVPLGVIRANVRDATDSEAALRVLTENMARKDLTRIELARAAKQLSDTGMRQEDVGAALGMTQGAVSNMLRVLERVPEIVLDVIERGDMSFDAARPLLAFWQKEPAEGYDSGREMERVVAMATPHSVDLRDRRNDPITKGDIDHCIKSRITPNTGEGGDSLVVWKPRDATAWALYASYKTTANRSLPTDEEFEAESPGTTCDFAEWGKWTYDTAAWNKIINRQLAAHRKAKQEREAAGETGDNADSTPGDSERDGGRADTDHQPTAAERAETAKKAEQERRQAEGRSRVADMVTAEAAKRWPKLDRSATKFLLSVFALKTSVLKERGTPYISAHTIELIIEQFEESPDWVNIDQWGQVRSVNVAELVDYLDSLPDDELSALLWRLASAVGESRFIDTPNFSEAELEGHAALMRTLIGDAPLPEDPGPADLPTDEADAEPESGADTPGSEPDADDLDPETEARMLAAKPGDPCPFDGDGEVISLGNVGPDEEEMRTCTCDGHDVTWAVEEIAAETDHEDDTDSPLPAGEGQGEGEAPTQETAPDDTEAPAEQTAPKLGGPHLTIRIPKKAPKGMGGKKTAALTFLERTAESQRWQEARILSTDDTHDTWVWQGSTDELRAAGKTSYADAIDLFTVKPEGTADETPADVLAFWIPGHAPRGKGEDKRLALQFFNSALPDYEGVMPAAELLDVDEPGSKGTVVRWPGSYALLESADLGHLVPVLKQFEIATSDPVFMPGDPDDSEPQTAPAPPADDDEDEEAETVKPAAIRHGPNLRTSVEAGQLTKDQVAQLHAEGCRGFEQPYSDHVSYGVTRNEDGSADLYCMESGCTNVVRIKTGSAANG